MTAIRKSFLLLALFLPLRLWAQPDSLTLNDVVRSALANNPSISRAVEDARASEARVGQTHSFELPAVEGSASYVRIDPVPEFDFGGNSLELAPHDNYDLHLGARYNVYDFGKARAQTRVTESRVHGAREAVKAVRTNVAYAAIRAFYSMLFLQRSMAVQDQEIAALTQHRDVARKKVEAGAAISYDVLTTEVRVAAVQNQRADALNALEKQREVLRELMGLPPDAPVNIRGAMEVDSVELNADSLVAVAQKQRVEMRLADDAENVAKLQQRLASLSNLPVLRASVQYGFKNGYEPNLDAWRGNWTGIAQLSVPVYSGDITRYQKQESDAVLRSEQYHRQALERQIQNEVNRAVDDVHTALEKLSISGVRVRQAEDAVTIARVRYESGTITNVDVLDAETSLAEARLAEEQAVFSFAMARTALEQALGDVKWEAATP
jgi:outer membrane protein